MVPRAMNVYFWGGGGSNAEKEQIMREYEPRLSKWKGLRIPTRAEGYFE